MVLTLEKSDQKTAMIIWRKLYGSFNVGSATLPNLLPESYRTDISMFLDTGNVWDVDYSDSVDDTNKIRSSIGIGANVFTTQ